MPSGKRVSRSLPLWCRTSLFSGSHDGPWTGLVPAALGYPPRLSLPSIQGCCKQSRPSFANAAMLGG